MNNERRKTLAKIDALLSEAKDLLDAVADEERGCFDNMPESLQNGERGQQTSETADNLEQARDELEGVVSAVQGILGA